MKNIKYPNNAIRTTQYLHQHLHLQCNSYDEIYSLSINIYALQYETLQFVPRFDETQLFYMNDLVIV